MKCSVRYEYDKSGVKLFVSNGSEPTGINKYIDYSKWSENRLKYLDAILDNAFNELIDSCNQSILNYKLSTKDI